PTTIETPKVTHTAVIQPPKSEQSHVNNTSPTATKSPEKPQTNFEAQLSQYAQAVGSNGESLASAPDWTKSVKGNMETFSRPASLQNNDSADGKYQLILVRDASGKITEAMWRTLAVSKDQGNTVVLDSFDLTKDGAWVGTATHYTGNGSQVETYKGQQWNNDTVQTFEEKMDNVGNNATTNPPKPLVYPS
ncbi:MAG TPA: hypothetical protein VFI84_03620, partial [Candidatus Saccharimonadales bacterium]|nr:hypothetical protein [Candidatus Saccharimonadales bacterium]